MPLPPRPKRRPSEFGGGGRRYAPRRKVCAFCADKIDEVDYKDLGRLRRFLSDRAKIEPRRKTGTCATHQRSLNAALKRARHLALLPFTAEHIRVTGMVLREPGSGRPPRGPRPPIEAPETADGQTVAAAEAQAGETVETPAAAEPEAIPAEVPEAPAAGAAEPMAVEEAAPASAS